jgi:hypothetical protein
MWRGVLLTGLCLQAAPYRPCGSTGPSGWPPGALSLRMHTGTRAVAGLGSVGPQP